MNAQILSSSEKLEIAIRAIVQDQVRLELAKAKRVAETPARYRLRDNLTVEEVVALVAANNNEISKNTIQRYERGAVKNPNNQKTIENVKKLAQVLSCTFEEYHQALCVACMR